MDLGARDPHARSERDARRHAERAKLHWDVVRATGVILDGGLVAEQGTREVAPQQSTTYILRVEWAGGTVWRSITVVVDQP